MPARISEEEITRLQSDGTIKISSFFVTEHTNCFSFNVDIHGLHRQEKNIHPPRTKGK